MVDPSCAVTTIGTILSPTTKGILADCAPDAVATPLTDIVAVASVAVGVNFMVETALLTSVV